MKLRAPVGLLASCLTLACGGEAMPPDGGDDGAIVFNRPDAGPDAALPPPSVGAPCAEDAECAEGAPLCLLREDFRDGYCTRACLLDECPEGSECTPIAFMMSVCLSECDPEAERACRPGYGCAEGGPRGPVCAPGCDVDEDCAEGRRCNADDGLIGEGRCYDPDAQQGDPCAELEACPADAWCILERDRGWPGGACTVFRCDEVADTGCEGDSHCIFDFYRDPICVDACAVDEDCRPGYACLPDETYPERVRCTPRCTEDAHCVEPGYSCNPSSGRCEG